MKLIIGNMTYKMQEFIKSHHFSSKMLVINKMCNVKAIKVPVDVIIPFAKVELSGLLTNTQVPIEELLMSVTVKKILYGNQKAGFLIEQIAKKYHIKAEYFDLSDSELVL